MAEPKTPEPVDVLLAGTVFFDLIFTGFPQPPTPGQEVWTNGMGSSPGGIANLAVACARLGLSTSLAAGFGDDLYGDWMWSVLRDQERVDLAHSRRFHNWHTPVTVSMALAEDRAMVTHGHPTPEPIANLLAGPVRAKAIQIDLGDPQVREATWWREARKQGALIFADAGWDPSQQWDGEILDALSDCDVFTPNAEEAMGYTRTDSAYAALVKLADHVPLAVVTCGREGALAIDSATGQTVQTPCLRTEVVDPTGAGDVFAAALILGTLKGWSLAERVRFAGLCSSLAVQQFGGSLAAPGWGDIADWRRSIRRDAQLDSASAVIAHDYAFIDDILASVVARRVRRAEGTIARLSDAGVVLTKSAPTPDDACTD